MSVPEGSQHTHTQRQRHALRSLSTSAPAGASVITVEEHWCQRVFLGRGCDIDMSVDVPGGAIRDEVVAGLSTTAKIANPGEEKAVFMRRIMVHTIEETPRHAGHADILREQIDGATGL